MSPPDDLEPVDYHIQSGSSLGVRLMVWRDDKVVETRPQEIVVDLPRESASEES